MAEQVNEIAVFAQVRPKDELRIVRALQARGWVAAMIDDGVNDALPPALKRADIGVVVSTASDVAKETADLILLDSHFPDRSGSHQGRLGLLGTFAGLSAMPCPTRSLRCFWLWPHAHRLASIAAGGIDPLDPPDLRRPTGRGIGLRAPGGGHHGRAAQACQRVHPEPALPVTSRHHQHGHRNRQLASIGESLLGASERPGGRSFAFASFAISSMACIFAHRSLRLSTLHSNPFGANKPLVTAAASGLPVVMLPFLIPGLRRILGVEALSLGQWAIVFGVALGLPTIVQVSKVIASRWRDGATAQVARSGGR